MFCAEASREPCQDISLAGKGAGIDGSRSGLWSEYARLVGELRPRYVVVENVAALLGRGMGRVLGDLAALGYDAEWDCIPASAVGAPHRRDRLWIVAYPSSDELRQQPGGSGREGRPGPALAGVDGATRAATDASSMQRPSLVGCEPDGDYACAGVMADPEGIRRDGERSGEPLRDRGPLELEGCDPVSGGHWAIEPDVGRVAYGVPHRVDRLRSLGNSLVPQIAQWVGERIVSWEAAIESGRRADG